MSKTRGRAYFYKMTCDNGGAPCVAGGLLSLAICKPALRRTARPGDLVVGFTAQSLDPAHRLVYLARVSEQLPPGRYYSELRYRRRPDCIYEFIDVPVTGERLRHRSGALYHAPDDLRHDCGVAPGYGRAVVLLSDDFRYYGKDASDAYRAEYPVIRDAINRMGRGHRVNHSPELYEALWALWDEARAVEQREIPAPLLPVPQPQATTSEAAESGQIGGCTSRCRRVDEEDQIGRADGDGFIGGIHA